MENFEENASGKLVRTPGGYLAFEPDPLPPRLTLDLPLVRLISEADRALGELAGIGRMLPNPHLLIGPFLRREAVLSSQIEGTVTRLEQLLLFEVQPEDSEAPDDANEVANYVRALEYGLKRLDDLPLCWRLLSEIHVRLMEGVRGADKAPGKARDCPVLIGKSNQSFEEARFVPPHHQSLKGLIKDFESFLNAREDLPVLIQLAVAHYQFETIHPFKDGNGRIGRLLITLMLCERKCLPQPLLYLSAFFEKHRDAYMDLLLEVSQKAAWNEWIAFFAQGVAEQSRDAVHRAGRLMDLWQEYRKRLQTRAITATALRLVDELFAAPVLTVSHAQRLLDVSFPTAQQNLRKLEDAGIVRETTKKQRNRVYVAPEILMLLDDKYMPPAK